MSSVYNTEPTPTGKIFIETSCGTIEVLLWCKAVPKATRAFLQLAIDGYYEGKRWHRVLDKFLIQAGAAAEPPTKYEKEVKSYLRKQWGGSEVLGEFKKEMRPRIRFNHRGQLALASPLDADGQGQEATELFGQFFITLDEAPWLNDKHVIIGTVNGATIFNALRIGRTEVGEDGNGVPVDMESAPVIKSIKIVEHSFTDLVETVRVPWKVVDEPNEVNGKSLKKKKKRKGTRNLNVLSFGAEDEEVDQFHSNQGGNGMISSHDVHSGKKIEKISEHVVKKNADSMGVTSRKRKSLTKETESNRIDSSENGSERKKQALNEEVDEYRASNRSLHSSGHVESSVTESEKALDREKCAAVEMMKKKNSKKNSLTESTSELQNMRTKYLRGRKSKNRDVDTFSRLEAFQKKLDTRRKDNGIKAKFNRQEEGDRSYHGQVLDAGSDDEPISNDWYMTHFKCKKHIDHVSKASDYVVIESSATKNRQNKEERNLSRRR